MKPFSDGVLAGATTPRQLADKARAAPQEAAVFFANGSVAAWYRANGWTYPVANPAGAGLAAVQQFFEALGLARPPRVEVCEQAVAMRGQPGKTVEYELRLRTADKRPIFALAVANQPWLTVGPAQLSGTAATLPLSVVIPHQPGQVLQACLTITANGGQIFDVPVTLAIAPASLECGDLSPLLGDPNQSDNTNAATSRRTPKHASVEELSKAATSRRTPKYALHLLPVAALLLSLLAVLGRDVWHEPPSPAVTVVVHQHPEQLAPVARPVPHVFKAIVKDELPEFDQSSVAPRPVHVSIIDEKEERPPVKVEPVKVDIKDEPEENRIDKMAKPTVDPRPRVFWQYDPNMRFGITTADTRKKLTYAIDGNTNQTLLRVNGQLGEFGGPAGRFVERDFRMPPDAKKKTFGGSRTVWVSGKVVYVQILELVPSKQPVTTDVQARMVLDTVRVRYIIENKDNKIMHVGLRAQIDTLIGGNDGVPFTVPGLPRLVTNFADFPKLAPIPDFIQALERPSLQNPGTVAQMSLKLGGTIEPPGRVSLTHWPGGALATWDVPLGPILGDSAVILYWNDKPLKPGEIRELGFAYGLGNVSSNDPGGKLGVTLGGSFEPGEAFIVTAYVQSPQKGQTLTLEVPPGLERIEGNQVQPVPPPSPGAANSIVTWKVKVLETGMFPLKVVSSTGVSQAKTISIERPGGAPEVRLGLDLSGSFEPGQEFTVVAKLTWSGPVPPLDPMLTLPPGLRRTEGPELRTLPGLDNKGTIRAAAWKVKVLEPGKHAVRVEWGGAATTKTVSIVRPETPVGGYFTMALGPPFAPGKSFTVTATVSDPIPDQTLTLQLPPGLSIVHGQPGEPGEPGEPAPSGAGLQRTMPASRGNAGQTVLTWQVMVDKPGSYPLRIVSSAGLILKKTMVIEQHEDKGGSFKLECVGDIAPGQAFTLRATVTNPVAGQKLTLKQLPAGLEMVEGPVRQAVPELAAGTHEGQSVVMWRLRVADKGTLPVRVVSTTGMVQSFTITIMEEQPSGSGPQLFGGKG